MDDGETNIDLEKIIKKFAWDDYDLAARGDRKMRNLRKKHNKTDFLDVRLDWSNVEFIHDQKDWGRLPTTQESQGKGEGDQNKNVNAGSPSHAGQGHTWFNQKADDRMLPDVGRPGVNVLFQTVFTNNSSKDQTYNLRTEKTTTSSCESVIESSFTKGFSMELTLKTPCEVFEANAGYSREFSLAKTQGETLEKSLTWSVESSILVEANHVAEAFLVVDEAKFNGDFQVTTSIFGDVGMAFHDMRKADAPRIYFTRCSVYRIIKDFLSAERSKTGKSKAYSFVETVDASRAIKKDENTAGTSNSTASKRPRANHVEICTRGRCDFRYGIKQEVLVNQTPLETYKKLNPSSKV